MPAHRPEEKPVLIPPSLRAAHLHLPHTVLVQGLQSPLECQCVLPSGVQKPHGVERDLSNESVVRHHHGHCPEQGLEKEQLFRSRVRTGCAGEARLQRQREVARHDNHGEVRWRTSQCRGTASARRPTTRPRPVQVHAVTLGLSSHSEARVPVHSGFSHLWSFPQGSLRMQAGM